MKNSRKTHCGSISCGYQDGTLSVPVEEQDTMNAIATHRLVSPVNGSQFIVCDKCLGKFTHLGLIVKNLNE